MKILIVIFLSAGIICWAFITLGVLLGKPLSQTNQFMAGVYTTGVFVYWLKELLNKTNS